LNSEFVLESIESQHGLLVERAKGIYSFSHLTFHEYFAAREIISQTFRLHVTLRDLVAHITEKRYREIFFLAAGMLPKADTLLVLMKRQIDHIMQDDPTEDSNLQAFLNWTQQKANSVNAPYKPAAIRAFYYDLALGLNGIIYINSRCVYYLDFVLDSDLARNLDCVLNSDLALDHNLALIRNLIRARNFDRDVVEEIDRDFALAERTTVGAPALKLKIQLLKTQLPNLEDLEAYSQWRLANGTSWLKNFEVS
jgi:predicted NACHT family NTPase